MQHQFQSLDQFLLDNQSYWRFEPFFSSVQTSLPWSEGNPQLCQWLNDLNATDIERYKQNNVELITVMQTFLPQLSMLSRTTRLNPSNKRSLSLPRGIDSGIPGRKLTQIRAIGEALVCDHQGQEWLEWCSGKGYLGRILASQTQQPVTSFEYQAELCTTGQHDADKQGLPMRFVQGDAFSSAAKNVFNAQQHAVALHACGDLHVTLIKHASQHQLPAITFSPCCYHLINSDRYQPLSEAAIDSQLVLSKSELRIPLQETVTGGERVKRHRMEEMSYRLGFDILLREELGHSQYAPVPSIKKSQLGEGFTAFCLWASDRKSLTLPKVDFDHYHQLGIKRYWHMERISLVQQPFRRALELWLVLDKVLYLQQAGYRVSLSEFCPREATPRNILIHAVKE